MPVNSAHFSWAASQLKPRSTERTCNSILAFPVACFRKKVWVLTNSTWSSAVRPTSKMPWSYLPDFLAFKEKSNETFLTNFQPLWFSNYFGIWTSGPVPHSKNTETKWSLKISEGHQLLFKTFWKLSRALLQSNWKKNQSFWVMPNFSPFFTVRY